MAFAADNHITILPAFLERFPAWKNFPTGLHVIVLDEDKVALQDIQIKLEACNYSVTVFSDKCATLAALEDPSKSFHLAIVEVNPSNAAEAFNIVRAAKHLPTILLSATKNVTLMMEGIAAGASEFMEKPLSEDKLKNLWQHVFKKALVTGELVVPKQEVLETKHDAIEAHDKVTQQMCRISEVQHIKEEPEDPYNVAKTTFNTTMDGEDNLFFEDYMYESDYQDVQKLCSLEDVKPAFDDNVMQHFDVQSQGPSTPQLEQAENQVISVSHDESPHSQDIIGMEDTSSTDDCSSFVHVKSKIEDMDGLFQSNSDKNEFQSLHDFDGLDAALHEEKDWSHTLFDDLVVELSSCLDMDSNVLDEHPSKDSLQLSLDCMHDGDQCDEEVLLLAKVAKAEVCIVSSHDYMSAASTCSGHEEKSPRSNDLEQFSKGSKSIKKKMKVDWTPELHRQFVQAVELLGVDKAIPSTILQIMGAQYLTRHNIASHLQKYRSRKKHIQARQVEAATIWTQSRQLDAVSWPSQPQVSRAMPAFVSMGLHVWGHPTPEHYWPKPWQSYDSSLWHQPPPVGFDVWGHPAPRAPFFQGPEPILRIPLAPMLGAINRFVPVHIHGEKMGGFHSPKDKVKAVINEVLRNPCIPLPLGLKPPSLESILSEL